MHFSQLNYNLKIVRFMKNLAVLFFIPNKKFLIGLCWSMLLVLEPNLSFQAIATPTGSLAQTSTNPEHNSSNQNQKPETTNSSDQNQKPDATNSSDQNQKPETNEQSTAEEDVIKELKGKWQGKDPSSNETMFYIFTEDNKLFIINKSQFGLFGVEAKYQVINVKNKPMQIDVDFGKNKTVQTIFEFANKPPLPNQKQGIKQLRIELVNLNSGNRPIAFSQAKTIILTNVSDNIKLENTPIVEYTK
ncbi:hypothetical protein VF14_23005 [Nostoc linckia z18]|nr:hypothetical protein VF05_05280 [Nostoc linckia z3]PHJ81399.1 hypothetical protein VF07_30405 [Nostoc linckia z6]PHJ95849.1 hypothetical protein VF04_17905 [Nostoc linckia z7]PHK16617.1 hypothetical protein VF10_27270 [Nostoc linckia z13]PHK17232.1 hypothetical protein VF11_22570 [Nostoc linckia z14]PHK30742.1 hypothetical protein VF12_29140 [Nostoc linckia z15]PHK31829.1 hypothetical protein VF14_23005 [Nostoc linckia z18]PHK42591.1 hypothetical protein VF13_29430 [Nostoc linckia z16]